MTEAEAVSDRGRIIKTHRGRGRVAEKEAVSCWHPTEKAPSKSAPYGRSNDFDIKVAHARGRKQPAYVSCVHLHGHILHTACARRVQHISRAKHKVVLGGPISRRALALVVRAGYILATHEERGHRHLFDLDNASIRTNCF